MLKAKLLKFYRLHWTNRVKQYGLKLAIKQLMLSLFKNIVKFDHQLVLLVTKEPLENESLNISRVESMDELHSLTSALQFSKNIKQNTIKNLLNKKNVVYLYVLEGVIIAYAAIQLQGIYSFGPMGKLAISNELIVFNNLFVDSDYRGHSIAKKLNHARIMDQQNEGSIQCVFVMKGNTPALNNWIKLGFDVHMEIKQVVFFNKSVRYNLNKNLKSKLCEVIENGLV